MLLYIIRHGEPVYNPNGLTQMGQEQAEAIAKRLSLHGIDKIYASPLKRARMTAEPLAKLLNKEVIIEEFMCEEKAGESFCVKDEKGEDKWMFLIEKYRREMQSKRILDLG
ncbi:MAG: histidine phosphatase family protein, partial [Clostridia bacterium]|nr:histidine phosphatase family protein [Clostridia bacterium]